MNIRLIVYSTVNNLSFLPSTAHNLWAVEGRHRVPFIPSTAHTVPFLPSTALYPAATSFHLNVSNCAKLIKQTTSDVVGRLEDSGGQLSKEWILGEKLVTSAIQSSNSFVEAYMGDNFLSMK